MTISRGYGLSLAKIYMHNSRFSTGLFISLCCTAWVASAVAQDQSIDGNLTITGPSLALGIHSFADATTSPGVFLEFGEGSLPTINFGTSADSADWTFSGLTQPQLKLTHDNALQLFSHDASGIPVITLNPLGASVFLTPVQLDAGATIGGIALLTVNGDGRFLTNLNATALTTGTIPSNVLPASVVQASGYQILTDKILASAALTGLTTLGGMVPSAQVAITGNGDVGVGTLTPQTALEIRRDSTGVAQAITLTNPSDLGSGGSAINFRSADSLIGDAGAQLFSKSDGNHSAHLIVATKTPGVDANPLVERLRVTSNGNVGIGTDTPTAKLQVAGNLRVGASTSNNEIRFYGVSGDGPGTFGYTAIAERLYGISDQSELLLFHGNDLDSSVNPNTTYADRIRIDTPGSIVFQTGNGARGYNPSVGGNTVMTLNSAGRVLVGTTTDDGTSQLQVAGGAKFTGDVNVKTKLRVPPAGDISMGEFTAGANPSN